MIIGNGVQFGNGVQVQNFNPSTYYNTGSVQFNGTSQYLSIPSNAALNFGTGDFTIEAWVYPTATIGDATGLISGNRANSNIVVGVQGAGYWSVGRNGSSWDFNSNVAAVLNTWQHVAVSRSGGNLKMFVNGTQAGTTQTNNTSYTLANGGNIGFDGTTNYFKGYISNLRVVNGTALYTASFTPSTVPLLPIAGTSLLTCQSSTSITDASTNAVAITNTGAATTSIYNPFVTANLGSIASGSTLFNGTSQYVSVPANSAFNFGSNNFTIECWFYLTATGKTQAIYTPYPSGSYGQIYIGVYTNNELRVYLGSAVNNWNVLSTNNVIGTVSAGQWYHVAVVRNGNTFTAYLNGTATVTVTNSSALYFPNAPVTIGYDPTVASSYINGYISNMRVVNGTAAYTANFTPSTAPLQAIAGTQLLTCQSSSTITDASTNAFTITNNGTAVATTSNPFIGGSVQFNGSNYLTNTTMNASFSGSFTFECWVYLTSYLGGTLFTVGSEQAGRYYFWQSNNGQPGFNIYGGANYNIGSAGSIPLNQWTHIAFVNQGTSNMYCYVNGVSLGSVSYTGGTVGNNGGVTIGARPNGSSGSVGYISNFRLVNSAVYTSSFTPSTTPLTAITNTSLLTCQSSSTITDASTNAFTITNTGSATATGLSPFAYPAVAAVAPVVSVAGTPSGSVQLSGASQYLSTPSTSNFAFGTGNFTVEFWVYLNTLASNNVTGAETSSFLLDFRNASATGAVGTIFLDATSSYSLKYYSNGSVNITGTTPTAGAWNHVAVVRNSGTTTMYLNGVSQGSFADSTTYVAAPLFVGTCSDGNGPTGTGTALRFIKGYVSNLRILRGTAAYTANFTPSTQPLSVAAGTALLTCQSQTSSTVDATGLNTISIIPGATTTNPVGGSTQFNGSNQRLSVPYSALLDLTQISTFTVEAWVNTTALSSGQNTIVGNRLNSSSGWELRINTDRTVQFYFTGTSGASATTSATVSLNSWVHIAVVRNGANLNIYLNGVSQASSSSWSNGNASTSSYAPSIGGDSVASDSHNGYISNLRLVTGTAVYTTAFTPSTAPLTAVSGTQWLTCQSTTSATVDASTNNFTITNNGTVVETAITPFSTGAVPSPFHN